jgi:hypothetical protein
MGSHAEAKHLKQTRNRSNIGQIGVFVRLVNSKHYTNSMVFHLGAFFRIGGPYFKFTCSLMQDFLAARHLSDFVLEEMSITDDIFRKLETNDVNLVTFAVMGSHAEAKHLKQTRNRSNIGQIGVFDEDLSVPFQISPRQPPETLRHH